MLRSQKYPLLLLCIAVAVLVIGLAVKPKKKQPSQRSELEIARLQRLTQQQRLRDLGDFLADTADAISPSLVYVKELRRPAVLLDDQGNAATGRVEHLPASGLVSLKPLPAGAPFSIVQVAASRGTRPTLASSMPDSGEWVMAIAVNEDRDPVYSYGIFQQTTQSTCGTFRFEELRTTIPLNSIAPGSALANLRGEVAGVVLQCGERAAIAALPALQTAMQKTVSLADRLQREFGIRVAEQDGVVRAVTVWENLAAARIGIQPGDELRAIDANAITTTEDVAAVLDHTPHLLSLVRGGRKLIVPTGVPAAKAAPVELAGLTLAASTDGVVVRDVAADGSSGVLRGDILLRIDDSVVLTPEDAVKAYGTRKGQRMLTLRRTGDIFRTVLAQ